MPLLPTRTSCTGDGAPASRGPDGQCWCQSEAAPATTRAFPRPQKSRHLPPRKTGGPIRGPLTLPVVTAPMLTMGRPLKMDGNAWQYLTDSVAGAAELGADAAGYYAKGPPPGRFLGRGLDGLGPGPGSVKPGDVVSAEMLHRMLAQLADPITGQPLGRLPSTSQRVPVAGYDLTFSVPKSVSLMWAMGDQATRAGIEEVMDQALGEVVAGAEDHVFFTRTGAQGARQEGVRAWWPARFCTTRAATAMPSSTTMPWFGTVPRRLRTGCGAPWTAKPLHPFVVALSERHVGLVEDLMTARFGVAWRETRAIAGRVAKREVEGVPPDLVAEFSRRTLAIEAVMAEKAAELEVARGRAPTSAELAGTGKTTALAGLLAAWEAEHGIGSVKGLAPSAAAAANLGGELGIATENTAKWLVEADREASRLAEAGRLRALAAQLPAQAGQEVLSRAAELEAEVRRWQLKAGDLLVVDEASLAGTFALDRLAAQARGSEAKVLLVGDWAQLGAVGAGGAFPMLVDDREVPPELSEGALELLAPGRRRPPGPRPSLAPGRAWGARLVDEPAYLMTVMARRIAGR